MILSIHSSTLHDLFFFLYILIRYTIQNVYPYAICHVLPSPLTIHYVVFVLFIASASFSSPFSSPSRLLSSSLSTDTLPSSTAISLYLLSSSSTNDWLFVYPRIMTLVWFPFCIRCCGTHYITLPYLIYRLPDWSRIMRHDWFIWSRIISMHRLQCLLAMVYTGLSM